MNGVSAACGHASPRNAALWAAGRAALLYNSSIRRQRSESSIGKDYSNSRWIRNIQQKHLNRSPFRPSLTSGLMMKTSNRVVDEVISLLRDSGGEQYFGEPVTKLEH